MIPEGVEIDDERGGQCLLSWMTGVEVLSWSANVDHIAPTEAQDISRSVTLTGKKQDNQYRKLPGDAIASVGAKHCVRRIALAPVTHGAGKQQLGLAELSQEATHTTVALPSSAGQKCFVWGSKVSRQSK